MVSEVATVKAAEGSEVAEMAGVVMVMEVAVMAAAGTVLVELAAAMVA